MSTYSELQVQIAELQKQAEAARAGELTKAKAQITEIMKEYGLTIADLGVAGKIKASKAKGSIPPQFKNPETGESWTGRGRAPRWLDGKDKEQYRIKT